MARVRHPNARAIQASRVGPESGKAWSVSWSASPTSQRTGRAGSARANHNTQNDAGAHTIPPRQRLVAPLGAEHRPLGHIREGSAMGAVPVCGLTACGGGRCIMRGQDGEGLRETTVGNPGLGCHAAKDSVGLGCDSLALSGCKALVSEEGRGCRFRSPSWGRYWLGYGLTCSATGQRQTALCQESACGRAESTSRSRPR